MSALHVHADDVRIVQAPEKHDPVIGSTPALVNPTLAVGTPTGGGINAVQVMALERELGAQDGKHNRAPPKVSSRSVHGNLLFPLHYSCLWSR